ncbi:MAG: hypothetical protein LWX56_14615 [Ignavibacteria bacterium]|nr:hypothetical protein [Ignavibacteria bacterium]
MSISFQFVKKFYLVACVMALSMPAFAQVSSVISDVKALQAKEGEDLTVVAKLQQAVNTRSVSLFYKTYGSSDYKMADMILSGKNAEYTIPANEVQPPFIEYYITVITINGKEEAYPIGAPSAGVPERITIEPRSPKDKELIVLSPEKNKNVAESEFFVSVSLLRATENVKKASTKIYLDNTDVTAFAVFAEDLVMFYPQNFSRSVSQGRHEIKVELYDNSNQLYYSSTVHFTVISDFASEEEQARFAYTGNLQAEARTESHGGNSSQYNNVSADLNGTYKSWEMNARLYVSSEEKSDLQPINRYSFSIKNNMFELNAGDHTPRYPSLIMNSKRVRGISGSANFGFFNIQASFGEINRAVEGNVKRFYNFDPKGISDSSASSSVDVDPAKYGYNKAELSQFGTYNRKVLVIHPSFGAGENFQWGLTYLHSIDDKNSVQFSSRPQENVVVGTDLLVGFYDQKILFTAQAAASVVNTDISHEFTEAQLDTFLTSFNSSDRDKIKDLKNIVSKFITFNQYLKPLYIETNPISIRNLPIVAAEGAFALNLSEVGNYFKSSYILRGSDYLSFGNTFLRTNVAGFNIMDRQRLFSNTLFITAGFENLNDNIQKTSVATSTFQTINASVAYYPRTDLPGLLVGFTNNKNTNDLPDKDSSKLNDATNRILVSSNYSFTYFVRHQVSASYSYSFKDDKAAYDLDVSNSMFSFMATSSWTDALTSNINVTVSRSEINKIGGGTNPFNYLSFVVGGKYIIIDNVLNVSGSLNPVTGDYKKFGIDVRAQYFVLRNLSLDFVLSYLINSQVALQNGVTSDAYNDMIAGITAQFNW